LPTASRDSTAREPRAPPGWPISLFNALGLQAVNFAYETNRLKPDLQTIIFMNAVEKLRRIIWNASGSPTGVQARPIRDGARFAGMVCPGSQVNAQVETPGNANGARCWRPCDRPERRGAQVTFYDLVD
jgi:hypothetical protein